MLSQKTCANQGRFVRKKQRAWTNDLDSTKARRGFFVGQFDSASSDAGFSFGQLPRSNVIFGMLLFSLGRV